MSNIGMTLYKPFQIRFLLLLVQKTKPRITMRMPRITASFLISAGDFWRLITLAISLCIPLY